ncbi:HNH endonuclease signature motif containing protein [Corynebacterium frankenforstense]|uniref:HNH endonuclease signature motif containing protein n=1 Tax=Corynebacterium frankenforstense TaxID=1230998 RepID=UPI0012EB31C1|nr:HNH endonuclease signature motif containing protein [Corynebacterium frankenforstense]
METISGAYEELADLIDPSVEARELTAMLPSLIDLEKTQGSKAAVDHAVAHLAGLYHAGNLTGTRRVDLFLAEIFDLTRREARARVDGAENIYGPARPAGPAPDQGTDGPDAAGSASEPGSDASGPDEAWGSGEDPGPGDQPGSAGAAGAGNATEDDAAPGGAGTDAEDAAERARKQREERERAEREREEAERAERARKEKEEAERKKAERRAAEERRRKAEADRREANRRAREKKLATEKLRIINNELRSLRDGAGVGAEELRRLAVEEADKRGPEDLRDWLRARVAEANGAFRDPLTAYMDRWLWMSEPDADGGAWIKGYIPPATVAVLKHLFIKARPGFDRPGEGDETVDLSGLSIPGLPGVAAKHGPGRAERGVPDRRTPGQRRADLFLHMATAYASGQTRNTGCASIVASLVAEDLTNIDMAAGTAVTDPQAASRLWGTTFPTNTGVKVSLFDLMALKAGAHDFVVLHGTDGNPLIAGRARRPASFVQKVAVLARDQVCSYPGCTASADESELHHLVAWLNGGRTDIENLTFRCKDHHGDNNDKRDRYASRGWAERDPETGRVGHTPPAASSDTTNVIVNETERASTSAGERIRRKHQKKSVFDEGEAWMADYEDYLAEKDAEEAGKDAAGDYGAGASGWSGGAVRRLYGENDNFDDAGPEDGERGGGAPGSGGRGPDDGQPTPFSA